MKRNVAIDLSAETTHNTVRLMVTHAVLTAAVKTTRRIRSLPQGAVLMGSRQSEEVGRVSHEGKQTLTAEKRKGNKMLTPKASAHVVAVVAVAAVVGPMPRRVGRPFK